ncbi:M28 family peptidase [Solwaraspora sp. WMMD1047]|uniref:M28 family peptidase n=1 Tax=Solwaraspora sp. WMMD1047 TaxID=3016102 RepID=UPI0024168EBB|nr:M28 family peptidase [Solwaraspora sp. WMMD1047]MDG4828332.1 M28 family peptidase [Solwaraspora sp. WMMD1047]
MRVSLQRPADRALLRPRHRALAAAAALAALAVLGAVALAGLRAPDPLGPDAPADRFSAGRAYQHVRAVAGAGPHAAGNPANDQVRAHLVGVLRGLGLETSVQDTVASEAGQLSGAAAGATLARVRNVVARLPGTDPTGRVFLVAHYDSAQVAPGGNDDGAGTSTVLEVARALADGPRPRNDIVFVLTDAEEACLCGAAAFAADHPLAADGGVVLNLEARGSTGPVIMFETSPANAGLVAAFARAAPHPLGTSFAVEIYRLLPNDTDFTAFLAEGFAGLNAAYLDGAAVYHTPLDTPESMDRASLQHHGDNTLAMAREFGAVDLAGLAVDGDATYFPVPGGLVRYPGWLTWPLAGLALAAVGALGWLARRRGRATGRQLAAGFGLALLPVLVAPVGAQLLWWGITAVRPGYHELVDPYRPQWYRLAVLALAAAVLFGWYALTRRRFGPAALAVAGFGWLAVLGLVLAAVMPGGAYLVTLPALGGAVGGLVALAVRPDGPWGVLAVTAGAAVGLVILLPTVVLLFPALGMAMGGAAALFAVLLGLAALPVVDLLHPEAGGQRGLVALRARRLGAVPVLAAALATGLFAGLGLAVDRFDAEHPAPTHLMYALDADSGSARWLSHETDPLPWTAGYVDGEVSVRDDFPGIGTARLRAGPAEPATLPAPVVETVADNVDGGTRTLTVRLVPQRPVRFASLHVAAADAELRAAVVAGKPVTVPDPPEGRWGFGVVFHAPPAEGVEITLVFRQLGAEVRLRAMDASDGLTGLPGFRPRPPEVGVAGTHSSELVAVARTYPL